MHMRKVWITALALLLGCGVARAQSGEAPAKKQPASKQDTVSVRVIPAGGKNQFRLEFRVVNSVPVAGMPIPVQITAKDAKVMYDSTSYEGGRVSYFQLKTQNPDSAKQTLLLGLIADLSGSKPSLEPGRGVALNVFYTADKPVKASDIMVEPIQIAPANILEFNVVEADGIRSVIPTFVMSKPGSPAAEKQKKDK
jgi:hypothetical protein